MQFPKHKTKLSLDDYLSGFMASEFVIEKYHIAQDKRSLETSSCWALELQSTVQYIGSTFTSPSACDLNEARETVRSIRRNGLAL